jgi:DNA polymerase-3 subunit delta
VKWTAGLAGSKKTTGKLTPTEFRAAVKAGKSFPCVLLVGPEDYLRDRDAQAYTDMLLPPDQRDFDLTRIEGETVNAPDMRAALGELPLLGSTRVLYIDNPADLNDESAAVLKAYLKAPSSALRLLLVQQEPKPEDRPAKKKPLKEKPLSDLLPSLLWIHYPPLKDEQRIDWIIRYLQDQGKTITAEAAHYVAETSSSSLWELAAKLDHAALFVGDAEEVDLLAIQRIAGITSEVTIYQLEDALHKGSLSQCLYLSKALLEGGETVLHLVGYLHWSLFRLWKVKATDRKKNRDELHQQILGTTLWRWKGNAFVQAARRMSAASLERALTGLLDLEVALKTRSAEGDILFYHWLWEVVAGGRGAPEPVAGTGS